MGEPMYVPGFQAGVPTPGVEFQTSDAQLIGQVAGLADDRVFSELFRVTPFDGTTTSNAYMSTM